MMTRIILSYTQNDGRVAIVYGAEGETLEKVAKAVPPGREYSVVNPSAIPPNRDFRNAWKENGLKGVMINMDGALEIHRNNIRIARAPKLAELDVEFQRALEGGGPQATARTTAIAQQKQTLRDLTADPAIDNAATPEDLVKAWPTALLGPSPYTT